MTAEQRVRTRLVSLDVLRGVAVMGMILVNSAAAMFYDNRATVYATLLHAHWQGLHLADLVFPAFLMMVGVAIPFSLKTVESLSGVATRKIIARGFRIFVIGLILSNLGWLAHVDASPWRFWGVLQRIGIVYGLCAILFLAASPKQRIGLIVVLLALYWPLAMIPLPDGQATDLWTRGLNFFGWVDRATLGAGDHIYVKGPQGYDPEGLLGTLPAIAHGLIGVTIGERLLRQPGVRSAGTLAIAGGAMLGVGLLWGLAFPIIKDIWSSSFVLVTCGITSLALAALHATIDRRAQAPRWPVTIALAFGTNAIAAYVLHEVTGFLFGWDILRLPYSWASAWLAAPIAALIPIAIYMTMIGAAMAWLRRRGWVITV